MEEKQGEENIQYWDGSESIEGLGAGDSRFIHNFLSPDEATEALLNLHPEAQEIEYHQMYHMTNKRAKKKGKPLKALARIKGVQSILHEDGRRPLYRFSVNHQSRYPVTDFSPTVERISQAIERQIGHSLNHAVVLCYRSQEDGIGFHQDKTLDIADDSYIVSVSLGAERPFYLKPLKDAGEDAEQQKILLTHGSAMIIGPETNRVYKHAIPKLDDEICSMRISVTLRQIGTYLNEDDGQVSGKGSEYQTEDWPFGQHEDIQ